MHKGLTIALLLSVAAPAVAADPADVRRAVAATSVRDAQNIKLDAGRKPAEVLTFLGLKKGMRVLDLFGANRYWAEIVAPAVGPRGQVVVWEPTQFTNDKARDAFATFAKQQPNVSLMSSPMEAPALAPESYDFALLNLDYHDVYWESDKYKIRRMEPDRWVKTLYNAMKPGGIVGLIDHRAASGGDTRAVVEKLHRIDPATARADFERAGFIVEATSPLLANPADAHDLNVFDEKIRGKTDRFIFKLRKPAK